MSVVLIITIVFSILIASMFFTIDGSAKEAFNQQLRRTNPSMVYSPKYPLCECPQCVLAESADTYDNRNHDKLAIYGRNRFNEWGKASEKWRNQVPVNGYSYGFYHF